jgi:hypothetical protein
LPQPRISPAPSEAANLPGCQDSTRGRRNGCPLICLPPALKKLLQPNAEILGALKLRIFPNLGEIVGLDLDLLGLHDVTPFWSSNFRISAKRARQYWR